MPLSVEKQGQQEAEQHCTAVTLMKVDTVSECLHTEKSVDKD